MTYIHGLPLRRGTVGVVRRGWSMLATDLPPAERGSRDEPGGTQLNFLLVNDHSSGSVGLATHAREILRRAWLLAQVGRSGVKKREQRPAAEVTRGVGHNLAATTPLRASTDLPNHKHPPRRPCSLSSHGRSKLFTRLSTRDLVFCQRCWMRRRAKVACGWPSGKIKPFHENTQSAEVGLFAPISIGSRVAGPRCSRWCLFDHVIHCVCGVQTSSTHLYHGRGLNSPMATVVECFMLGRRTRVVRGVRLVVPVPG
jgi:hypothetical protein